MSSDAAAGRALNVTSTSIAHLRGRVEGELKVNLSFVKSLCGDTGVAAPGFGLLGDRVIGGSYEGVRAWAEKQLGEAVAVCDSWSAALAQAERNWRTAENASKVRYV